MTSALGRALNICGGAPLTAPARGRLRNWLHCCCCWLDHCWLQEPSAAETIGSEGTSSRGNLHPRFGLVVAGMRLSDRSFCLNIVLNLCQQCAGPGGGLLGVVVGWLVVGSLTIGGWGIGVCRAYRNTDRPCLIEIHFGQLKVHIKRNHQCFYHCLRHTKDP